MNRSSRDPYEILGVSSNSSEKDIRKRYRKLCKRFHPDLHQGDPQAAEMFKEVKWAYETILTKMKQQPIARGDTADLSGAPATEESGKPFFGFFHAVRAYMKMSPKQE